MARFSLRKLLRRDRGAAVMEFALMAPLLFLFIWATIAFGRGYHRLNVLTGALREGGRIASTLPDPCGADEDFVNGAVARYAMAFGSPVDTASASYDVFCPPGTTEVHVLVDGYPLFSGLTFFGMDALEVDRTAIFRRELP